jgi:outer membrane receptor protein involved in Fe transport
MHRLFRIIILCLALFLIPQWVCAQGQLGALTGSILDPTRALVPEAQVTITNMDTGVKWEVKSSTAGYYRVPVPPGKYQVEARKEGFKAALATNIVVPVEQVVTIDLTLQVGSTTQSITVSTEAPLLTTSTAEVGAAVTPQEFQTLPVILSDGGRQLDTFVWESMPGTTPDWNGSNSINGGQDSSHLILIDGVSIARYDWDNMSEFQPGADSVGEFKVQMANYSAEYGETGGGVLNFSLKSGNNQFHGAGFEYNINPIFNANGLLNNAYGSQKSSYRENNFGGNIGGPVRKNKTFFFFNYEGDRWRQFAFGGLTTVPTSGMLKGNFNAWLGSSVGTDALGRTVYQNEIYDPTTTRTVTAGEVDPVTGLTATASTTIRDPFDDGGVLNAIPAGEFSTATSTLLQYFPTPAYGSLTNNIPHFGGTCCPVFRRDAYTTKVDEVINDEQKLSVSLTVNIRHRWHNSPAVDSWSPWPSQPLTGAYSQDTGGPQLRILHTWTINDHTVNVLSLGYNRFADSNHNSTDNKFTPAMKLPGVPDNCFPGLSFADSNGIAFVKSLGSDCGTIDPEESYLYLDSFSITRGKHSLKFGGSYLHYRSNDYEPGPMSGSYSFNNLETSLPGFVNSTGHPFASFLMGAAHSATDSIYRAEPGYRQGVMAFFAQDDWRATSRLTLNLGVRWEIPTPKTEAFNRMAQFDPTATNTLPSGATLPGALVWLGHCSACVNRTSFQDYYFKEWAPRLGLAYQFNNKLVLRGGYGISYQPPIQGSWGPMQYYGFNSSVTVHRQAGSINAVNPVMYLSNFANGSAPGQVGMPPFRGTLPNTDPTSMNGQGVDYFPANSLALPYIQNWSGGFQYQLPHEVVVEANYVGSKGTRLINRAFSNVNQPNGKYMGLGDILADDFQTDLSNPATAATLAQYGITKLPYPTFESDNGAINNSTVATGLQPFPQYYGYGGVYNDSPGISNSTYHAMELTVRKNSTHGLTFIAAYTLSKDISDSASALQYNPSIQDLYNRKLEKSIVGFDYPQSLKLTWIYSLPFGRGQRWLHSTGLADRIFSGWQLTAIQRYGSGDPLAISSSVGSDITPTVRPDVLSGVAKTVTPVGLNANLAYDPTTGAVTNGTAWLNPAAFVNPPTSPTNGYALRPGTAGPYLPNVRGPGHKEEDFGLIKDTRITERVKLELRADFQNVFNRTGLGDPDTLMGDGLPSQGGTFGLITGPMNGPRIIQMGMHITF